MAAPMGLKWQIICMSNPIKINMDCKWTTMDNNGQQSAVLHTSVMPFLGRYRAAGQLKTAQKKKCETLPEAQPGPVVPPASVENWPPKFGHQVAPLALVPKLASRWRHLQKVINLPHIALDCPIGIISLY